MLKSIKNSSLWIVCLLMVASCFMTSCDRESNEEVSVEGFEDSVIRSLQSNAIGKKACLELIFPVTIQFIDDSTLTAEDYESLHDGIAAWFETNEVEKDRENKPNLVFPVQVMNEEGEIIDVADQEQLRELKSECRGMKGTCKDGKDGRGHSCFSIVFPIDVIIGGVTSTFEDRESLKAAVRAYKEEAGDDAERPQIVFPISVQYEDGTVAEAADQDALKALKEACSEG